MHLYPQRASLHGLEVELFKLVSYGATPEQWADWLRVPLEHAVVRGNLDLVNRLLGAGANGKAGWRGCRGRTLVDAAAVGGSGEVVSALVRAGAGADVNTVSVSSGRSALYTATFLGHEACARQLILSGADATFEDPVEKCVVLTKAVQDRHERLVQDLLIAGANPNLPSQPCSVTPLHVAVERGDAGILSALLLAKADKDARDVDGETPLIRAVKMGHLAIVKTLLEAGADCNIRRADTYSALDLATECGRVPVLRAILGHGVDVNSRDQMGISALHSAAITDQADAVHALIEAGADIEITANTGWTPLHASARHHTCNAMLALLRNRAAVNSRIESTGDTPLHRACSQLREPLETTVDLLLRWGADETAANSQGRTPLQLLDSSRLCSVQCSPDEMRRTRNLLVWASENRAWRRRSWLVMLRARAVTAARATNDHHEGDGDGDGGDGVSDSGSSFDDGEACRGGQDRKMARFEAGRGTEEGLRGDGLGGLVSLLVGLGSEALFRAVVGFL
eukprot:g15433.t1